MKQAKAKKTLRQYIRDKFIVEERFETKDTRKKMYVSGFTLIGVGLVLFIALALQVANNVGIVQLDHQVEAWIIHIRNPLLTNISIFFAVVFGPIALPIIVLTITIVWLIFAKHAWRPLLLAGFMTLGVTLIQIITRIVQRHRPPIDLMLFGHDSTYSFPSGHVSGTADFFIILGFLIISRKPTPKRIALGASIAFVIILSQVFSRVYLGYHWLSDTLGSICLALIIIGIVIVLDTWRTVRIRGEKVTGAHSQVQTDNT